jgi:hypothetical protein
LQPGQSTFQQFANQPTVLDHKDNATEVEIAEDNRQHRALHLEFALWYNGDAVLQNLPIAAVHRIFIAAKKNPVTGVGSATCLKLLTHLHNNCYRVWAWNTNTERVTETLLWFPTTTVMTHHYSTDIVIAADHYLSQALLQPVPASSLSPLNDIHRQELLQL